MLRVSDSECLFQGGVCSSLDRIKHRPIVRRWLVLELFESPDFCSQAV